MEKTERMLGLVAQWRGSGMSQKNSARKRALNWVRSVTGYCTAGRVKRICIPDARAE